MKYPETTKGDQVDDYHGVRVPDPYRWLEDTDSPKTHQWIDRQNEVTFGYLHSLPQREWLKKRITRLWDYPKYGLPSKEAGRYFFTKNSGLQNQAVLYVQPSKGAEPRALLDPNALAPDGTVALSGMDVTDDGKLMAYGLSRAGSDWQELRVKNVDNGADREGDVIRWSKFSRPSWTKDGKGFFYSRYPEPDEKSALRQANRNHRIHYHVVGTTQEKDRLVYERPEEPEWMMAAEVSEDGRYALLSLSKTGPMNRLYYIALKDPMKPAVDSPVVKLIDAFEANYDFIGNDGPVFYLNTDLGAPRSRVVALDVTKPDKANWKTLVPEGEDALENVLLSGNAFVASYLHDAYNRVRFFDLSGKAVKELELPGLGTVSGPRGKRTDDELFYAFTSFLVPTTIYRYDVKAGRSSVFRKPETDFDASPYESKQVWYTSKDGTRIPMFLTHRKGLKLDGSNPTFLTGYGGFRVPMTPGFSVSYLPWIEAGGVLAIPNLRGGGEYGETWHLAGTKDKKQNVFDDFIAAAEYLVREGYTSPKKLAIGGGSNGGLLVGAVLNQRPDLFAAALPAVGVMDMLRYHKFTIGSAWAFDFGTSDDPGEFKALYAYSPLHNIKPGTKYPAILVTTADHDDRVVPGHSFKYAATLQAAQGGDAPVLIRVETKAGHGGGKPTTKIIEEQADKWAFVMQQLGMK
jgi:prolyl oligopeptidase